jgi:glycosyltransferase involved in cell wall biosynthesis
MKNEKRRTKNEMREGAMSSRNKARKKRQRGQSGAIGPAMFARLYARAGRLAEAGSQQTGTLYHRLEESAPDARSKALVANDLAVLAAVKGNVGTARDGFRAALQLHPECEPARLNLAFLEADYPAADPSSEADARSALDARRSMQIRVAVLSFLFNWPSTGGGIVHTVELCRFLGKAGYGVRHIYARYPAWGIGGVQGEPPLPSEVLGFDESEWNVPAIQRRFREAVEALAPDYVIITDSWNMKPVLAEAVAGYPYILRLQAMECLCPLNNMRLLPERDARTRTSVPGQCALNQPANPGECAACIAKNGHYSGGLHQAERMLAGVGAREYHERLLRVLRGAEAVLVVNPLTEELLRPYSDKVRVVTAGMDASRFVSSAERGALGAPHSPLRVFFAGLVEELSKGFHVLQEACALLWTKRRDFELVVTGEPAGKVNDFTRYVGWLSQEELPAELYRADMVVLPAVGQEALGRTAVEAMAAGRAVIASRIGGLPATVVDGVTGLLCEPGDAADVAKKIETLLDDPVLRERLGQAGRRRFEEEYSWDVIIERHYRPLLRPRRRSADGVT